MQTIRLTLLAATLALAATACQTTPDASSGADAGTAVPAVARPSKQYAIEDFVESTGVGGASFSADESRLLFHSNRTGIWNAYTIPVAGGE